MDEGSAPIEQDGPTRQFSMLSVPLWAIHEEELVALILDASEQRAGGMFTYATANTVVLADRLASFRSSLELADVCYADGMGVVLATRVVTGRRIHKVTANDFFPSLVDGAMRRGLRVACVGGPPGVAEAALHAVLSKLSSRGSTSLPRERAWCRAYSGYLDADSAESLLRELSCWQPHLVVVGMGQPRQEEWVLRVRPRLPGAVFHCVGGLFDVLGGRIGSPPQWVRRYGLEWLYRLLDQPRTTWRRYLLGLPVFAWMMLREAVSRRLLPKQFHWT
jgi:N-acetylglucosaminyldiphosphoundecaprenol N-acetyl-beta-D-mannosaminyltransferase